MYDDDDYNPLEADREYMHEIARDYGKSPSGEPLPRHVDKDGRVWVTCNCGSKFLLRDQPNADEPEIAAAILEILDQEN